MHLTRTSHKLFLTKKKNSKDNKMVTKTQFQAELENINDIIAVMRCKEETYKSKDYLSDLTDYKTSIENIVNEACREKMALWFYQVIEFCNFNRTTANIAMAYLDKYVGTKEGSLSLLDRREYQLSAMCCFELAVKTYEPHLLDLKILSELSHGAYSQSELQKREHEILTALRWRMCPPTASCFASYYLDLLPQNIPSALTEQIKYVSMFQIENSIKDYSFLSYRPSEVAFSSVLNAISIVQNSSQSLTQSFRENMNCIDGLDSKNSKIFEIRRMLRSPVKYSPCSSDDKVIHCKESTIRMGHESHANVSPNCVRSKQA